MSVQLCPQGLNDKSLVSRIIELARLGATPRAIGLAVDKHVRVVLPVLETLDDDSAAAAYRAILAHVRAGCKWSA